MDNYLLLAKKHFEIGLQNFENSEYNEAERSFRLSLSYSPNRVSILNNLASTLIKLNKIQEAQEIISHIFTIDPNDIVSILNQGNIYLKLHNLQSAAQAFLKAIIINPHYSEAYNNYGFVLQRLGYYDDSLIYYDKAIDLNKENIDALYNKTQSLIQLKKFSDAIKSIEIALKINLKYNDLYITYIYLKQQICDWSDFNSKKIKLLNIINNNINISSIFCLLSLYDDPNLHFYQSKKYSVSEFPFDNSLGQLIINKKKRISIGYFSADFHNHATAYLITELFELHDKSMFEIHAFSYGPNNQDHMRMRIKKSVEHFHNVKDLTDIEIAQLARSFNIDISIDLKGYTFGSRPGIFSKRTAPIQVNYLGYPGSMGAEYIDYIIADSVVIPPNSTKFYTEKIVYLPNCYQVNDTRRSISDLTPQKEDENLPIGSFVFCCFNNVYKILPDIFSIWMNILKKVENSVLWLLEDNPIAKNNLISEALINGVDESRLIFARRKNLDLHLARHCLADLFLDTFPYNAHTTSSDALWAGLPVLTCRGDSFASRVSSSLLNAIDAPELITINLIQYQSLAIELAENKDKLSKIKEKIIKNRITSPLFDTKLFTSNIENAYIKMYNNYHDNKPKKNIIIN